MKQGEAKNRHESPLTGPFPVPERQSDSGSACMDDSALDHNTCDGCCTCYVSWPATVGGELELTWPMAKLG